MNISDVIRRLEELKAEHGDVRVDMHDDWNEFPVEKIEFEQSSSSHPEHSVFYIEKESEYWFPDRVVFTCSEGY